MSDARSPASVVVLGGARTPFGTFGGPMRDLSIPHLASIAVRAALDKSAVAPDEVDEVALGVNFPGGDRSIARQAALRSGIPDDRTSYTVDRACCSSLVGVALARRGILVGDTRIAVAGGAENLSKVPYFVEGARFGARLGDLRMTDQLVISCPHTGVPRAVQASDEAAKYGVSRMQQDEWALRSHTLAFAAQERGLFDDEIVAVDVAGATPTRLDRDESIRSDPSLAKLAQLPRVNGSASVTAGNAPGLSTGAAVVVLTSEAAAAAAGQTPIARIVGSVQVSGPAADIASIPATAIQAVLRRTGRALEDVHVIEINEAFAAVPLVATLVLAGGVPALADEIRGRTNLRGGAIALGHPTGATGARLLMSAIGQLRQRGGGFAIVAMCGGVGEGEAVAIEVDPSGRS